MSPESGSRERPWLVTWRSHEHEWNGRGGRRFASDSRAQAEADRRTDDGCYEVRVDYSPALRSPADTGEHVNQEGDVGS